jgi:hypothetical protein
MRLRYIGTVTQYINFNVSYSIDVSAESKRFIVRFRQNGFDIGSNYYFFDFSGNNKPQVGSFSKVVLMAQNDYVSCYITCEDATGEDIDINYFIISATCSR